MSKPSVNDILLGAAAFAVLSAAVYLIVERDDRVLGKMRQYSFKNYASSFRPTVDELRIAKQFSDTSLPQLSALGLIKQYTRTEIETIITVSGKLWDERSSFFKESLLEQIVIYNKVNGFSERTRILDESTNRLLAEIVPPDRRTIF